MRISYTSSLPNVRLPFLPVAANGQILLFSAISYTLEQVKPIPGDEGSGFLVCILLRDLFCMLRFCQWTGVVPA